MERAEYIRTELARLLRDWFVKASLLGAGVFLLFSPLDFVSVPERFSTFFLYRLVMAAILVALALTARKATAPRAIEVLIFLAVFFSAVTIEIMILQFHGHHSPYYAGMMLLAVVALGFFPAGFRFQLLLASTIYLVYLLPLLVFQEIHEFRIFFTQSYFLLFVLGACVIIRYMNTSILTGKIGLNFEVMEQQSNLGHLVEERTAKLLQASDEWRVTFDSTEDMMMLVDGEGAIVKANKATASFAGREIRDLVGKSCFDLLSEDDLPRQRHPLSKMKVSGRKEHVEFEAAARNRWFLVSAEPLRAGHLREEGAVLTMRDITGIKILERGLVESKEEWEETFNIIQDGISIHEEDHTIIRANLATRRLLGAGDGPLEGRKCYELFHGTDAPVEGCPGCEARKTGEASVVDIYEPTLGKYLEITALPRPGRNGGSGGSGGIIHVVRDITERKEALEEIDRAYRRMERILEMAPFAVFIVNSERQIEYANSAIHGISGMPQEQFVGTDVGDLPGCSDIGLGERIDAALEGESFRLGPVEFRCHQGEKPSVGHFTGVPVEESGQKKVLVFVDDVTELKKAEEERTKLQSMLLQTQKMESIGTLAGGVAHDFNNILTAILNYAGITLMKLPEEDPVRKYVTIIEESGERAAALTKQLLTFSRRQSLQMAAVDLNDTIEQLVRMLRRIISEDITLDLNLHQPLEEIMGDRGKIEQIILNLAVNARDAMPRGGLLTIETAPSEVDADFAELHEKMTPGPCVRLTVSDTGSGIPPEVLPRIFEPFYTTKKAGEGTGLGLATAYGIVVQHRGSIEVRSSEGKGTEFIVHFPLAGEEERAEEKSFFESLPRGSETVLIVDDEKRILESTEEVLSSIGYRVLTASSGEAALEVLERHPESVDLLLTDIVMTGMDGQQLAEEVVKKRPGIKVLFMSGYAPEKLERRGLSSVKTKILDKPVGIRDLAVEVRTVLDGGEGEG